MTQNELTALKAVRESFAALKQNIGNLENEIVETVARIKRDEHVKYGTAAAIMRVESRIVQVRGNADVLVDDYNQLRKKQLERQDAATK